MAKRSIVYGYKIVLFYFLVLNLFCSSETKKQHHDSDARSKRGYDSEYYHSPTQYSNMNAFTYAGGGSHGYGIHQFFTHIQPPDYPQEIVDSSMRVSNYLAHTPISLQHIIHTVNSIQGLNPLDRLVALLLRVQSELPLDCAVKSDISTLILYNMMKSYLNIVPVLTHTSPGSVEMYMTPSDEAMRYRNIIAILLSKLKCCQSKVLSLQNQLGAMNNFYSRRMETVAVTPATKQEIELRVMPETTTMMPEVRTEIRYIEKPCPTTPPPPPTTTMLTTTLSPYLQFIEYIPKPKNAFERMKYEKISALFKNNDLLSQIGDIDFGEAKTDTDRLYAVLKAASKLDKVDKNMIDGINYYLNLAKSAAALNLSMQKEIRKQFELTKIFTATFNFETLSAEGKQAFDSFFHFLLDVTGEQMVNFTTWTEAKTKGEFIKLLFEYFLQQDFTPPEIKDAIHVLVPSILTDGEGAEPV